MRATTIVQPFFLTDSDELLLSERLKEVFPAVRFVDNNRWPTAEPVTRESIAVCTSRFVFLWPSDKVASLPFIRRDEVFEGPQTALVMQMMRSKRTAGGLLSGQLGTGFSEKYAWMSEWAGQVVGILRQLGVPRLRVKGSDKETAAYVVGPGAAQLVSSGGVLHHDSMVECYELAG